MTKYRVESMDLKKWSIDEVGDDRPEDPYIGRIRPRSHGYDLQGSHGHSALGYFDTREQAEADLARVKRDGLWADSLRDYRDPPDRAPKC